LLLRPPEQQGGAVRHALLAALESGLEAVRRSPLDAGTVELIARRPAEDERELLEEARLDPAEGLAGDYWLAKLRDAGKTPNPDTQLTLMNARAAAVIAGPRERWSTAGDQ